ncbi:MAG: hypothetical protein IJ087_10090 [Eggerthellaceae bacterium]|nr:hypothetical protein [Eggerthellaceae bacterium]
MADVEYRPSKEGMRALLGSEGVLAACIGYAGEVRDRANSMVSDDAMVNDAFYASGRVDSNGMARASAYTGNPHGYNACLSENVLLKALG